MFKYNIGQASQERGIEPYSFQPKRSVEVGEEDVVKLLAHRAPGEEYKSIGEVDVVRLLAHRAPGEEYKSIHPPLEEMEEPECAVREMVEPITPRERVGIEPGILAGRTIVEARERNIEKITKELVDSETVDIVRTGLRGRTVHGHSVRLYERGMMFDVLRRWALDEETGEIRYAPRRAISAGREPHSYLFRAGIKTEEAKTEEPTYEKFEEVISEKVLSKIMKEILEIYGRGEVAGREVLTKLNIIEGLKEDIAFKSEKGLLKPLDMVMTLQIKKFAKEMEKEDLIKEMEDVEEKYFEGVPTLPKEAEYLRQKEIKRKGAISFGEAKRRTENFTENLKESEKKYKFKVSPLVEKYNIRRLLDRTIFDIPP